MHPNPDPAAGRPLRAVPPLAPASLLPARIRIPASRHALHAASPRGRLKDSRVAYSKQTERRNREGRPCHPLRIDARAGRRTREPNDGMEPARAADSGRLARHAGARILGRRAAVLHPCPAVEASLQPAEHQRARPETRTLARAAVTEEKETQAAAARKKERKRSRRLSWVQRCANVRDIRVMGSHTLSREKREATSAGSGSISMTAPSPHRHRSTDATEGALPLGSAPAETRRTGDAPWTDNKLPTCAP